VSDILHPVLEQFSRSFNQSFMTTLEGLWRGAWFPRAICYMFREGAGVWVEFPRRLWIHGWLHSGFESGSCKHRSSSYKSRYCTCTQAFNALAWTHVQSV